MNSPKPDEGISWRRMKSVPPFDDFTFQVQQAMAIKSPLTHITTIAKHERHYGMMNKSRCQPDGLARWEEWIQEVQAIQGDDGELWGWQMGMGLAAFGGIAVVRNGSVIRAWCNG
jgi:hypothetical protein